MKTKEERIESQPVLFLSACCMLAGTLMVISVIVIIVQELVEIKIRIPALGQISTFCNNNNQFTLTCLRKHLSGKFNTGQI